MFDSTLVAKILGDWLIRTIQLHLAAQQGVVAQWLTAYGAYDQDTC